jgi:hypothetical protein
MKRKNFLLSLIFLLITFGLIFSPAKIASAEGVDSTAYYDLFYQVPADVYLGKGGVFMVSSSYNATATINRFVPDGAFPAEDLEFFDRWIDFSIYDYLGNPYLGLWGFNYVYFNLKYNTRILWEEGELSIYRWDTEQKDWIECPTFLVEMKNLPHGRVTCIMPDFGLYGIAVEK